MPGSLSKFSFIERENPLSAHYWLQPKYFFGFHSVMSSMHSRRVSMKQPMKYRVSPDHGAAQDFSPEVLIAWVLL